MNNYKLTSILLKNVQYNFTNPDRKLISLSVYDSIKICEIFDNQAILQVNRELSYGEKTDSYIRISYEVSVANDEAVSKDNLSESLKNKSMNLSSVFSKISLLISEITNLGVFGPLVTAPNYDPEKINIE